MSEEIKNIADSITASGDATSIDGNVSSTSTKRENENETSVTSPKKKQKTDDKNSTGAESSNATTPYVKQSIEFTPRPTLYDKNGKEIQVGPRLPKKKVAIMIGYCGTGYHGMQLNPPQKTIEADLFDAMVAAGAVSAANSTDIKKNGFMRAARTDKGVHAAGNMVSMKIIMEDSNIVEKINAKLPEQIRIWGIERVGKSFDCRKMCDSRVYEYLLPTYCLLPPKPSSVLGRQVAKYDKEFPGIKRPDSEGEAWWVEVEKKLKDSGITQKQIDEAQIYLRDNEEGELSEEMEKLVKQMKSIENTLRRSYRVSDERIQYFQEIMNLYVGSHNFFNFTVQKSFNDNSSRRYMLSTKVSSPFVINNTEWVSIKIHGQSFMLHQIRKMIGMATMIVRTGCPASRITEAFENKKINVPKAPALGLLLENPMYDGINQKLAKMGYGPLSYEPYSEKILEFKKKYIYDKIYDEEVKENTFHGFYGFIDNFNGEPIYDYFTAKGITNLAVAKGDKLSVEKTKDEKEKTKTTEDKVKTAEEEKIKTTEEENIKPTED